MSNETNKNIELESVDPALVSKFTPDDESKSGMEFGDKPKTVPVMKIRYHKEKFPELPDVTKYGNFIDLYNAEERTLKAGESTLLNLGISVECPDGYWMQICPRSSTFSKYGIIQTNSFGVVDTKYSGDDDIVKMPVYALRDTIIPANERICQFRLVEDIRFTITPVDKLNNKNRGGFGSSGRK